MSSDAWAATAAALGASTLTLAGTYGMDRLRERRDGKDARAAMRRGIYLDLLNATGAAMMGFTELRVISDFSSRWFFGWGQITKTAPAQPTLNEIAAKFQVPMERILAAQSHALLLFDDEEMAAVNRLVNAAQDFDTSKPPTDADSVEARLGTARLEFAAFARTRIGEKPVKSALEPGGAAKS